MSQFNLKLSFDSTNCMTPPTYTVLTLVESPLNACIDLQHHVEESIRLNLQLFRHVFIIYFCRLLVQNRIPTRKEKAR